MHSVVETPSYLRAAKQAGMTAAEMQAVVDLLSREPESGDPMEGTGGCRKIRIARRGGGKSGGYRVVSFFSGTFVPVFLITVFGKGEKANLSRSERNALKKLADSLVETYS